MRKTDELNNLDSCLTKALPQERIFVLLGRDASAPVAIRSWAADRIARNLNRDSDPQIQEAYATAFAMENEWVALRALLTAKKLTLEAAQKMRACANQPTPFDEWNKAAAAYKNAKADEDAVAALFADVQNMNTSLAADLKRT